MSAVERHLKLLPGIPLIDSPIFDQLIEEGYFTEAEQQTARSLDRAAYPLSSKALELARPPYMPFSFLIISPMVLSPTGLSAILIMASSIFA